MKTVLHITPHLGGGVGRVLLSYLDKVRGGPDFSNKVLSLEYANERALSAARSPGFPLQDKMSRHPEEILAAMAAADVVLIHWWNHPLLYAFLVRETLPPARIIFWSHVSGFHAPYVFSETLLHYPDLFVFTSPLSLDAPEVKNLPESSRKTLRVIWSTGGIDHVAAVRPRPHRGFKVGYLGTVDYSKMHPNFLKMSSRANLPDAQFIVCGGPGEKEIQEESRHYEAGKRFTFVGQVDDITPYLSEFDVFGYPLAPYHWGTCEQALGESMAAGVPPVVLANRAEGYIVEDGVTGIVAGDEDAYARALEELYRNPELRRRLAGNAREAAAKLFSLDLMASRWEQVFDEILSLPKTARNWRGSYRGQSVSAHRIFLESLGDYGKEFICSLQAGNEKDQQAAREGIKKLCASSYLWRSNTRGTPHHYHNFFPEDNFLKLWSGFLKEESTVP